MNSPQITLHAVERYCERVLGRKEIQCPQCINNLIYNQVKARYDMVLGMDCEIYIEDGKNIAVIADHKVITIKSKQQGKKVRKS